MMSKGKSVAKSIRMTDEVFSYIDGYRGNGFNEKLENLVLDAIIGESSRVARFEKLDKDIEDHQAVVHDLFKRYSHLSSFLYELETLSVRSRRLFDVYEKAVPDEDISPEGSI